MDPWLLITPWLCFLFADIDELGPDLFMLLLGTMPCTFIIVLNFWPVYWNYCFLFAEWWGFGLTALIVYAPVFYPTTLPRPPMMPVWSSILMWIGLFEFTEPRFGIGRYEPAPPWTLPCPAIPLIWPVDYKIYWPPPPLPYMVLYIMPVLFS